MRLTQSEMMRRERKKPSSSHFSLISRALAIPWLSKFKGMKVGSAAGPAKEKQNEKLRNMSASSSLNHTGGERGQFYKEGAGERGVVMKSLWYESVDGFECPDTSCQSHESDAMRSMETQPGEDFKKMTKYVKKKRRELHRDGEILASIRTGERHKGNVIMTPRISIHEDNKWVRTDGDLQKKWQEYQRKSGDTEAQATKSVETDISGLEKTRMVLMNTRSSRSATLEEDDLFSYQNLKQTDTTSRERSNFEWQKLKERKIKEVKLKDEERRKSVCVSRELNGKRTKRKHKTRVISPRASSNLEKFRVKALQEMKAAKLKTKAHEARAMTTITGLDSYAVVKRSFDPQKDFRDSMVEMITENKINRPDELEELLVCYLTLNSDEYHDLIMKAFRQVWFDLKQACFDAKIQNEGVRHDLPI